MKRVVIGLSGGVDSSVAAYLLQKQGYDVIGLYMINWHDITGTISGDCPWKDDLVFAELVARKLKIPFHTVDFSKKYKQRVVDYMFDEYEKGRTPNPDVLCNREIKFDLFLQKALELGADHIATGHYCRKDTFVKNGNTVQRLLAGKDPGKEQSYFLCQLTCEQIEKALFPLGDLHKSEVRQIAKEQQLPTAEKKDSQGICFVGKVDLPLFLQQKLSPKKGHVIEIPFSFEQYRNTWKNDKKMTVTDDLEEYVKSYNYSPHDGKTVGEHNGAHFYTIGQRKGLNIGGTPKPLYVIATDVQKNIIYTGQGENHPGLFRRGLFIDKIDEHWIREDLKLKNNEMSSFLIRIRYRQPLQKATLFKKEKGIYIIFEQPQRGITPGQFAAWYDKDELLGSGIIN